MSLRPIVQFTFSLMKQIFLHASLCARLAIRLLDHLCRGTKTWVIMLLRLLSFTVLLTPGWYQLVMYWLFDKNIRRNVAYSSDGASQRHLLDLYLPLPSSCCCCNSTAFTHNNNTASTSTGNTAPVIIFVSGGAWMIGYKMWSALIARGAAAVCVTVGALVVVPDYTTLHYTTGT